MVLGVEFKALFDVLRASFQAKKVIVAKMEKMAKTAKMGKMASPLQTYTLPLMALLYFLFLTGLRWMLETCQKCIKKIIS